MTSAPVTRLRAFVSRLFAEGGLERACAGLSFFVPFAVALAHVGSSSTWRDDLPLLRGLSWVGNGRTGALWSILVQASFFVPLGSVYFRAGLVAAIALGAAGVLIFFATRDVLARTADSPRLAAMLATIAALTTTLCATGQREGTVAGGGALALLAALLILQTRPAEALSHPPRGFLWGVLWGGLLGESHLVAAVLLVAVGLGLIVARARVTAKAGWFAFGGAMSTAAFVLAPAYLRPFARSGILDWTGGFAALAPAPFEASAERLGGIGAWRVEVGTVALVLAAAGGLLGLARTRLRGPATPLVAIVLLDAALSFGEGKVFSSDDLAPLHLLAIFALAVGVALSVQTLAGTLLAWRLPLARGAAVFLLMTDLTLAAASAEEASFTVDRSVRRGAEAFTDEALEMLSPNASILVRSHASAARLWSARVAQGARPDVLVVPLAAAGDTRIALALLRAEPAIHKVLRDVALDGRPGEEALTVLADTRPLLVELDTGWDRRVLSHLVPDHLWLRFAPEPRGPSDRKAAAADLRARFARVLAASVVSDHPDRSTSTVLRARLTDAAVQAALLGDREEANLLLDLLGQLGDGELLVAELRQRLWATKSGPLEIKGLLR